jgi:cyclopropane-fatty-acyl-phospholipid synthase
LNAVARVAFDLVEQGLVHDAVVRNGIRRLCAQRLREISADDGEASTRHSEQFLRSMETSDVAPVPHLANEQHYEVPAEFFGLALGPHRKYSSAWWPVGTAYLAQAEALALEASCERLGW